MMFSKRSIRVMPDYCCSALWVNDPDECGAVPPDADELGLSVELSRDLERWADRFTDTLVHEDPIKSGFASAEEEAEFVRSGFQIALRLKRELGPGWKVDYFDRLQMRDIEVPGTE